MYLGWLIFLLLICNELYKWYILFLVQVNQVSEVKKMLLEKYPLISCHGKEFDLFKKKNSEKNIF